MMRTNPTSVLYLSALIILITGLIRHTPGIEVEVFEPSSFSENIDTHFEPNLDDIEMQDMANIGKEMQELANIEKELQDDAKIKEEMENMREVEKDMGLYEETGLSNEEHVNPDVLLDDGHDRILAKKTKKLNDENRIKEKEDESGNEKHSHHHMDRHPGKVKDQGKQRNTGKSRRQHAEEEEEADAEEEEKEEEEKAKEAKEHDQEGHGHSQDHSSEHDDSIGINETISEKLGDLPQYHKVPVKLSFRLTATLIVTFAVCVIALGCIMTEWCKDLKKMGSSEGTRDRLLNEQAVEV